MKSIITAGPSTSVPAVNSTPPAWNQVTVLVTATDGSPCTWWPPGSAARPSWSTATTDRWVSLPW